MILPLQSEKNETKNNQTPDLFRGFDLKVAKSPLGWSEWSLFCQIKNGAGF